MSETPKSNARPLSVTARIYVWHTVTAVAAFIVFICLIMTLGASITESSADVRRAGFAIDKDLVLAGAVNDGESFYNLNGGCWVFGDNGERLGCDTLMAFDGAEYSENAFKFAGGLSANGCAVSSNLMHKYGVGMGDELSIYGTDVRFTIEQVLPAQSGIDGKYLHYGVVVFAYDARLAGGRHTYVTFSEGADGKLYKELTSATPLALLQKSALKKAVVYAAIMLAVIFATIVVSELFIARRRRDDYRLAVRYGASLRTTIIMCIVDFCIKYVIPFVLAAAIGFCVMYYYGLCYILPMLAVFGALLIYCAILIILTVKRVTHG